MLNRMARAVWAPADRLAAVRVVVGVFAFATIVGCLPSVWKNASLPASRFRPVLPLALWDAPPARWFVLCACGLGLIAALAVTLGLRHRIAGPLLALMYLWITGYRSSFGMIFHSENLLALHALVLAFAPAADSFSLDARRRSQATPAPALAYGGPLFLLSLLTALAYFIAGVAKLRWGGADWATGEFLRNQVLYDNLRKAELGAAYSPLGAAASRLPWLFAPLAVASLALEVSAPVALLHVRMLRVWSLAIIAFHWGILILMAVAFPYPLSGAAFVAAFAPERAVGWARQWNSRRPSA